MTVSDTVRDDLFTNIHKALRVALFDVTAHAGRTDWTNGTEVTFLGECWQPLLALLHAHTRHEDQHILRILDPYDPNIAEPTTEHHRDLDDLLDHLSERFEIVLADPEPDAGLALYRDLARFVGVYLPHLHDEETRVMARIWEMCSDEELAATRAAFMAGTSPEVMATTIEYMLPALDRPARHAVVAHLAATAPVIDMVLRVAEGVLDADSFTDLAAAEPVDA